MGRIIRDQIVASTHTDSHGERLDEGVLTDLFRQMDNGIPSGVEHDVSQNPIVRILNKRLVKLGNGEVAIKVDFEILDEDAFSSMGGFSISFTRHTRRYGDGDPQVRVLVNPRQFDFDQVCDVVRNSILSTTFDVTEKIEKAEVLTTAIIAIIIFAGMQFATGFFNAGGAHLYEVLRKLRRKDNSVGPIIIQFHFKVLVGQYTSKLILIAPHDLQASDVQAIDTRSIESLVASLPSGFTSGRIVATIQSNGQLKLDRVLHDNDQSSDKGGN